MAPQQPESRSIPSRRTFLRGTAAAVAGTGLIVPATSTGAPALIRSGRPSLTHGVQSGDVGANTATLWTRTSGPAKVRVELSTTPSFRHSWRQGTLTATPQTDFAVKSAARGLPSGADVWYRLTPIDQDGRAPGEPVVGHLRTPARRAEDVNFVWSGDLAGQGWGIDLERGGYRIFDRMRELDPDFFLCNGDSIYADGPIEPTVELPDGTIWRNVVTDEKSAVAQTLAQYRGQYKYNLLDPALRRFLSEVPQLQQWDDHETKNNWYPGQIIDDPAYSVRRVDVLAARARRAWHEYMPIRPAFDDEGRIYRVQHHGPLLDVFVLDMRTFRNANSKNDQTSDPQGILGQRQLTWLKSELRKSKATWKVISNDMPMGIVVADGDNYEAMSQGDPGDPLGRELQMANLLSWMKREAIHNVVWVTTDVHYTAAHRFDPSRAAYSDFDPFWQFVTGPLNAGSFPASPLDDTFGPQQVFVKSPKVANTSPATEYQFFGQVQIAAETGALTVNLRDNTGASLWTKTLQPR